MRKLVRSFLVLALATLALPAVAVTPGVPLDAAGKTGCPHHEGVI